MPVGEITNCNTLFNISEFVYFGCHVDAERLPKFSLVVLPSPSFPSELLTKAPRQNSVLSRRCWGMKSTHFQFEPWLGRNNTIRPARVCGREENKIKEHKICKVLLLHNLWEVWNLWKLRPTWNKNLRSKSLNKCKNKFLMCACCGLSCQKKIKLRLNYIT